MMNFDRNQLKQMLPSNIIIVMGENQTICHPFYVTRVYSEKHIDVEVLTLLVEWGQKVRDENNPNYDFLFYRKIYLLDLA